MVVGDVVTAVARVAETVSDADQKQVRVEIEMHNQHGRLVARGDAGVIAAPPMRGERNSNG